MIYHIFWTFVGLLIWILIIWLLCGCSLQQGNATRIESIKYLNIVNPLACADSLREADKYLESNGITIIYNVAATKTLVCLPTPSWFLRNLSPVYLHGFTSGNVAWAQDDAKVILHELGHLFGLEHGGGLMITPDALQVFATGFTNKQLEELKR